MAGFCSCLPPPASLRAPKVYNILVPDVFPRIPPNVDEPLPEAQLRKIGKLAEYVRNNPAKIPKVSRRLYRQVLKSLPYPNQAGHVVIAAEAYTQLLHHCQNDNAPYGSTFFTPELLTADKPLIQTLLTAANPELRMAGSRLLSEFLLAQDSTANAGPLVALISQVCDTLLKSPSPKEEAAMMKALQSYVEACNKLNLVPIKLDEIQVVVVKTLQSADPERKEARETATSVAKSLKDCAKDLSSIHTLIEALLHQGGLPSASGDSIGVGHPSSKLLRSLQSLSRGMGEHRFTLLSSLLHHVSERGVTAPNALTSIQVVTTEAAQLPDEHAASILALSLQLLPHTYSPATHPPDPTNPAQAKEVAAIRGASHKCIQQLAVRVGTLPHIYAAAYAPSASGPSGPLVEPGVLECALVALQIMRSKGVKLECAQLPPSCVSAMAAVLTSADPSTRLLAHATLEPLLLHPRALQDPIAATALQAAVVAEAQRPDSTPKEFPPMAALWRAIIAAQPPSFAPTAAAAAVQLAKHAAQVDPEAPSARRACAALLLVNQALAALEGHHCPSCNLAASHLDVQAGCPEVKSGPEGLAPYGVDFPPTSCSKAGREALAAAQQHISGGSWEMDLLAKVAQGLEASSTAQAAAGGAPAAKKHKNVLKMLGSDDGSPRHMLVAHVEEFPEADPSGIQIRVQRGTTEPGLELLCALE